MTVSLIIPVYNAGGFLRASLAQVDAFISNRSETWELILVVDASPDDSLQICQNFASSPHAYTVHVLNNESNLGKGGTVRRGMLSATGKYRIFIDCDLAYPMEDVGSILAALQNGADMAIASRVHPDSVYTMNPQDFHYLYTRHLSSRIYNIVINNTLLKGWSDTQAGLKGFSAQAAEFIFRQTILRGFSFDIEILFIADRSELTTVEVPIHFRYAQEPSTMDFLSDALRMLRDIVRVFRRAQSGEYSFIPPFHPPRQLIIHADDLGLSPGVNSGILHAMEEGRVTSASVLCNLPDAAPALHAARERRHDIGWHVNLTLGRPLTHAPSLVQKNGCFYPLPKLILKSLLRQLNPNELQQELEAQFQVMRSADIQPSHLDGHQHCHILPGIREVVRDMARHHGIHFVRVPVEQGWGKRWAARLFLRIFKGGQFWQGFQTLPFMGVSFLKHAGELPAWKQTLAQVCKPCTEIMVHPGIIHPGDEHHGDDFPGNRQAELDLLLSEEWDRFMKSQHVVLTSFGNLDALQYPSDERRGPSGTGLPPHNSPSHTA